MASVNKVILVGNLGRDPDVRYSADGAAVCNISIATTSSWKDKATGEKREEVEWHRIVFYGRLAEVAGQYLKKGRPVYIEGRLKTRKWQDKQTGVDRFSTDIIADQMQMLGNREDGDHDGFEQRQAPARTASQTVAPTPQQNQYAAAKGRAQPSNPPLPTGGGMGSLADLDSDLPWD